MDRKIIFSSASLLNKKGEVYADLKELLLCLKEDGYKVIFMSHNASKLNDLLEEFDFVEFVRRSNARSYIDANQDALFILVGSADVDLQLAASRKILLINPLWSDVQEQKAIDYGLGVETPNGLNYLLKVLKNQTAWYYTLNVDEATTLYSLSRANYKGYIESETEVELVKAFEKILKEGNKRYFKLLLVHFIASIINNPEFKEVDIWAIMPSSGTELNKDMLNFKNRAREIMGRRSSEPLFERYTPIQKSRGLADSVRVPCDRHFETIRINPFYEGKLKGKNICVLDDYLNNGTSFETMRNLLKNEGVRKIIFVSLGRFQRRTGIEYFKQDYELSGDVYGKGSYSFILKGTKELRGVFNDQAREDIRELYKIIKGEI